LNLLFAYCTFFALSLQNNQKQNDMNRIIIETLMLLFAILPIKLMAQNSDVNDSINNQVIDSVYEEMPLTHLDSLVDVTPDGDSIFIDDLDEAPIPEFGHPGMGAALVMGFGLIFLYVIGVVIAIIITIVLLIIYFRRRNKKKKQDTPPQLPPC